MSKHPYADILIAIANGENIQIQHYDNRAEWDTVDYQTVLSHIYQDKGVGSIRIKPKTTMINGHEVPEPLKVKPKIEDTVYSVAFDKFRNYEQISYTGCVAHHDLFTNGVLHSTKEAAIKHAEALLSFTKIKK